LRRGQEVEVLAGDRIAVFLSEEVSVDEHVDAGRKHARTRSLLKESNGSGVLLTPENELSFFLTLSGLAPRRHDGSHEDGHDAQTDQERRHRVSLLTS
jgi:hypothetical protein